MAPGAPVLYPSEVLPVLLALALAAASEPADDDAEDEPSPQVDTGPVLTAVGGLAIEAFQANGRTFPFAGVQAGWSFGDLELGLLAQAYRFGDAAVTPWSPIVLVRLDQRFETMRGAFADLGIGIGAGRVDSWQAWFQATVGIRLERGPVILGAEVGFEQNQLLRLGASLALKL